MAFRARKVFGAFEERAPDYSTDKTLSSRKLLAAFSNRPSFSNGLDRFLVNRNRNGIENEAVTNETAFV